VVGEGFVAVFACVKYAAALHLDSDDVERAVVMRATCLRIEIEADDSRALVFLRRRKVVVRD
jgi:hypothetical protein